MKAALASIVPAVLGQYDGEYYGPHMMGGGWWWMWLVWIGGFFLVILVIYLIVGGLRNSGSATQPLPPHETALDILKKRYARGEISRAEYEQMKKDLEA